MSVLIWLGTFLFLVSSAASKVCDRCVHTSSAAISNEDYMKGACQYGADKTEFNGAHLAGATTSIYKDGAGCGASYKVRCTDYKNKNCNAKGITVIVTTNTGKISNGGFVLSKEAFKKLFNTKDTNLNSIPVEYKRVPSYYGKKKPMCIRLESTNHLAIKILYQGGQTYIWSVKVSFDEYGDRWSNMTRGQGAIWEAKTKSSTGSTLTFHFVVTQGTKNVSYESAILDTRKKSKLVYGLAIQLDGQIAQEKCNTCGNINWG